MKKIALFIAALSLATSVSAQTVTESKTFDNMYIGLNGGLSTKTTGVAWMKNLNPNLGVRIGRYFTPVFGLALESNAYFSNKPYESTGTAVRYLNTSLLGTVNLTNWLGGYKGEPRCFEVSALYGLGWGHVFGNNNVAGINGNRNDLTSKLALDFAFNFGSAKQWQFYIEPAINWGLDGNNEPWSQNGVNYNVDRSAVQLNVGIVYKFKNSNGTHNFTIAQLRDQNEIDALNAQINDLRGAVHDKDDELAAKNRQIADLKRALDDCEGKAQVSKGCCAGGMKPVVVFRQGKAVVDKAQYANIEQIAKYMKENKDVKMEIKGYASPEGGAKLNQRLSEKRADAVKKVLVNKYKIAADRLTTRGMGATGELSEQVEFNRVATFNN